jgi:hypothetical protein
MHIRGARSCSLPNPSGTAIKGWGRNSVINTHWSQGNGRRGTGSNWSGGKGKSIMQKDHWQGGLPSLFMCQVGTISPALKRLENYGWDRGPGLTKGHTESTVRASSGLHDHHLEKAWSLFPRTLCTKSYLHLVKGHPRRAPLFCSPPCVALLGGKLP